MPSLVIPALSADLDRAQGRFQFVNIDLDKAGGLTSALRLADTVEPRGMGLMIDRSHDPDLWG